MRNLILAVTAVLNFFGFSHIALAEMAIESTSFVEGKIAKVHACTKMGGKNQSPPMSISGLPSDATHIAIIMDDPDANSVAGKTRVVAVMVECVHQTANTPTDLLPLL